MLCYLLLLLYFFLNLFFRSRLTSPFRSFKMSIEQVPFVSTLLRAARDANEILLKETLRQILVNGISKEELNSTDNSGRVSFLIFFCVIDTFDQLINYE